MHIADFNLLRVEHGASPAFDEPKTDSQTHPYQVTFRTEPFAQPLLELQKPEEAHRLTESNEDIDIAFAGGLPPDARSEDADFCTP
jgi:hypothetical protein